MTQACQMNMRLLATEPISGMGLTGSVTLSQMPWPLPSPGLARWRVPAGPRLAPGSTPRRIGLGAAGLDEQYVSVLTRARMPACASARWSAAGSNN